jgi:hypothetical protein
MASDEQANEADRQFQYEELRRLPGVTRLRETSGLQRSR